MNTPSFETKRCLCCRGYGKVIGGGLIAKECSYCEGKGKLYKLLEKTEPKIEYKKKRKYTKRNESTQHETTEIC